MGGGRGRSLEGSNHLALRVQGEADPEQTRDGAQVWGSRGQGRGRENGSLAQGQEKPPGLESNTFSARPDRRSSLWLSCLSWKIGVEDLLGCTVHL